MPKSDVTEMIRFCLSLLLGAAETVKPVRQLSRPPHCHVLDHWQQTSGILGARFPLSLGSPGQNAQISPPASPLKKKKKKPIQSL